MFKDVVYFLLFTVVSGDKLAEHTLELNSIISGLQPSTGYEIHVGIVQFC